MIDVINQLGIFNYLNILLILFLLAIGYFVKYHCNWIPNRVIPIILLTVAIIYELPINNWSVVNFVNGVVDGTISAAIAVGLHSSSKEIKACFLKYLNQPDEWIKGINDRQEGEDAEYYNEEEDEE